MDGNGRWAERRRLPRHAGHRAGVDAVRCTVQECVRHEIGALTLFAFSSENWQRPKSEVGLLMDLFLTALQREARKLHRNNVRLQVIGERSAFSEKLQSGILDAERLTAQNTGLRLQVAANYGGRWDITQAARRLAEKVAAGLLKPEEVCEQALAGELAFAVVPDPDLYIRTGGEQRLSNFMLWQAGYSELFFTEVLWPDFDAGVFSQALEAFAKRQRRFGRTADQLRSET